jgi:hypothetical protein
MNEEQIQQVLDALLKTGELMATNLWRISLKQVYAEIPSQIVFSIILFIVAGLAWRYSHEVKKMASRSLDKPVSEIEFTDIYNEDLEVYYVISLAMVIVTSLAATSQLLDVVQILMNPEYRAIEIPLGLAK